MSDYEHDATHGIRQSIIYSGLKEVGGIGSREFLIIPNFRELTNSFSSNRAFLFVASKEKTYITLVSAKLRNRDTGFTELIELGKDFDVSKPVSETGYFLGFVPLLSENYNKFNFLNTAKELELTITYSVAGGKIITESFIFKLVRRKETAWVT